MQLLELSKCKTKTYGLNTALRKGTLLWNILPNHFKGAKSLTHFKNKIRQWTGGLCTYVAFALKLFPF